MGAEILGEGGLVFPARAGMIRGRPCPRRRADRIPRESGDDPGQYFGGGIFTGYSPRERG